MLNEQIGIFVKGHVKIVDDLGNVLVDKDNAVHPQNMAQIFARALSHEPNYYIYRMAFGNGGTEVTPAFTVTFKTPNDGQPPDPYTWQSRIYHETYSEIVDDNVSPSSLFGTDPGSADWNTGVRTGGGAVPAGDPPFVPNVSGPGVHSQELGVVSEVIINCVLNEQEPMGQFCTDYLPPTQSTEDDFVFDEIGLYTYGAPAIDSSGYQYINVQNRTSSDDSGLAAGTPYSFVVTVDGGSPTTISFTTPAGGGSGPSGEILYGDLCEAINTGDILWAMSGTSPLPGGSTITITDDNGSWPTIIGAQTYGFLRIESGTSGNGSTVLINGADPNTIIFLAALNPPLGATLEAPVAGVNAGIQNDPNNPDLERERLLAHLIFSPVLKAKNRALSITYTLSISVARTPSGINCP